MSKRYGDLVEKLGLDKIPLCTYVREESEKYTYLTRHLSAIHESKVKMPSFVKLEDGKDVYEVALKAASNIRDNLSHAYFEVKGKLPYNAVNALVCPNTWDKEGLNKIQYLSLTYLPQTPYLVFNHLHPLLSQDISEIYTYDEILLQRLAYAGIIEPLYAYDSIAIQAILES